MNLNDVRDVLDVGQTLITVAIAIYVWTTNRDKANKQAIEQLSTDVAEENQRLREDIKAVENRILKAESDIQHLPNHDALAQVHQRINEVGNALHGLQGEFKSMNHTLQLIHQHLMDNTK